MQKDDIDHIEDLLKSENKLGIVNTFDIRDAVNRLIASGKAVYSQPGYKVKLKE